MDNVEEPLTKKPRMDISNAITINSSSQQSESTDDDEDFVLDENDNAASSSDSSTLETPGSKRKHSNNREERYQQREFKRRSLELEEKERKEKERERQKQAKLEEKLKKEAEKKQKQLEREQLKLEKEAAKKAKEEERLRKKAEKEEATRKAKEEKQRTNERKFPKLDKFLVKMEKPKPPVIEAPCKHWLFSDFEIKKNMTVAPVHCRNGLTAEEKENLMKLEFDKSDYLQHLPHRPSTKINKMKAKFFQFHTEHRPAYWGTWRKRSKIITGRRPFAKDTINDYGHDSDDEWENEEEVQGDECDSEDDDDIFSYDEEETNDGFIVEHGYLSSDEGLYSDEEQRLSDDEASELRHCRMKKVSNEWKKEQLLKIQRNRSKLVPNKYGPYFSPPDEDIPSAIKNNLLTGILLNYLPAEENEDSDDSELD